MRSSVEAQVERYSHGVCRRRWNAARWLLPSWADILPLFPAVIPSSQVSNTCNHTDTITCIERQVAINIQQTQQPLPWFLQTTLCKSSSSSSSSSKHVLIRVTLSRQELSYCWDGRSLSNCLAFKWRYFSVTHGFSIGELPKLCVKIRPDSWLVFGPFHCHREWRHEWQHGGLCPCRRSFGCVLLLDQILRKQCTVRQYTTLIYLINLLGKLVLGLWLDSELHYFSIFTQNKKNEHLIFCECHGR